MSYQGVALLLALGIGIVAAAFSYYHEQRQERQWQEQPHRSTGYSGNTWTGPSEPFNRQQSSNRRRRRDGKSQCGSSPICAICKKEMLVEHDSRILPCSHRFHFKCINSWTQMRRDCPTCMKYF